jgi:hypothetical protein
MALNSRSAIDSRWLSHNLKVVSGFNVATIEIFDSNISDGTYNAVTNTWTGSRTTIWSGEARIQPVTKPTNRNNTANPTSITEVEVHFNYPGDVDILPGHQIFVTASPYNTPLTNMILTVRSSINSSNAWNRVLVCEVDEEVRRSV